MLLDRRYILSFFLFVFSLSVVANDTAIIPAPPQIAASSYILMDAYSGDVLIEHNADERLDPASLTKLMTTYIADYELEQGNLALNDNVIVSNNAWAQKFPGSSVMFLEPNKPVTVLELLKGVSISSGNDATVALAEHIAGSESAFVDIMNQHAQLLGLQNTHFENPHGLTSEAHYSSARDMALLAKAIIIQFPENYKIHAEKEFTYNGIRQTNRNRLLWRDPDVDGLKTGHTSKAGYCLVASAKRQDMRLIAVVMGSKSDEARFQETQKLFSYGFRYYHTSKHFSKGDIVNQVKVWGGEQETLDVKVADDVYITIPRALQKDLKADLSLDKYIQAHIDKEQVLGEMQLKLGDKVIASYPLVAAQTIKKGSFFTVLSSKVKLFFIQAFGG